MSYVAHIYTKIDKLYVLEFWCWGSPSRCWVERRIIAADWSVLYTVRVPGVGNKFYFTRDESFSSCHWILSHNPLLRRAVANSWKIILGLHLLQGLRGNKINVVKPSRYNSLRIVYDYWTSIFDIHILFIPIHIDVWVANAEWLFSSAEVLAKRAQNME